MSAPLIIAVYGIQDGSGKTSVAREIAGNYLLKGKKTLLADVVLGHGRVTSSLRLPAEPNLGNWLSEVDDRIKGGEGFLNISYTEKEIGPYIQKHYTGLNVLATSPLDFPGQAANILDVVLRSLKNTSYEVIVLDTQAIVRNYVLKILTEANAVLLVVDTFRYDIEYAKEVLERLEIAGVKTKNFRLVLNRFPSIVQENPEEIAAQLGLPVAGVLPEHPELKQANVPARILSYEVIDQYTKSIEEIITRIQG